jgi:hypothetical protein
MGIVEGQLPTREDGTERVLDRVGMGLRVAKRSAVVTRSDAEYRAIKASSKMRSTHG